MPDTIPQASARVILRWGRDGIALARAAAPRQLICTLVLTVVEGLLPVVVAWGTRTLLDGLAPGHRSTAVLVWSVVVLVLAGVCGSMIHAAQLYLQGVLHRRVRLEVRVRLFAALNREPGLASFEDPDRQDQIRLAEQAGDTAPQQAITAGIQLTQAAVTIAGFLVTLFVLLPWLVAVVGCAAIPIVILQMRLGRLRATSVTDTSVYYRRLIFYRLLATDARAAKEIRLFGLSDFLTRRMLRDLGSASAVEQAVDRTGARFEVVIGALTGAIDLFGIAITVYLAARGDLTVGDVTALLVVIVSVHQVFRGATDQAADVYQSLLLFGHYVAITDNGNVGVPAGAGVPAPSLRSGIEFDDVWFRYVDGLPWALCGVTFRLPAGAPVGLVGLNGAGKTTVVKLLCRMYEPQRGAIRWDGVDIRHFDAASLRSRISAVFQDFMTYDFTAGENIGVGNLRHLDNPDRITAAARHAGADDAISALPHGYRTLLSRIFPTDEEGERAAMLSGGQWQRIALARAFLRDEADVLVLDEPSSGLDAQVEHALHQRLTALSADRLTILISHRLNALREAETIIVLKDGRVIEYGSHHDLMRAAGHYAELFTLQAQGYVDADQSVG